MNRCKPYPGDFNLSFLHLYVQLAGYGLVSSYKLGDSGEWSNHSNNFLWNIYFGLEDCDDWSVGIQEQSEASVLIDTLLRMGFLPEGEWVS